MDSRIWKARRERIRWRMEEALADVARAVDWHALGGRRFFERHCTEIIRAHKWCFIVGCNNSGTSLLQRVLERSGAVSTFVHEGQRYTRALARARKRGHERVWTEFLDELGLTATDSLACVPRLVHDWMRELQAPVREIVLEKTPANTVRMTWLQEAFPRSYFIGLVRNGYVVAEGIRRKGGKPVERGARHWGTVNRIMLDNARHVDHFLEVRYEDLVNDFAATVRRIAAFLQIEPGAMLAARDGVYDATTVLGSGEYGICDFNGPSLQRLTDEDIRAIRREAGEMLEYFGYGAGDALDGETGVRLFNTDKEGARSFRTLR